jgi:PKD repeat protein
MKKLTSLLLAVGALVLTACGGGGSSSSEPSPDPAGSDVNAGFTVECNEGQCKFDGSSSSGDIDSYQWDFGDGSTASGVTPNHDYASSGDYTVKLTVSGDGDKDSRNQTVSVAMNEKPVADYSYSCVQLECFFDASTSTDDNGIASYQWDFGDGSTASGVTADYTFDASGSYDVTLTVTDDAGLEAVYVTDISVVTNSPLGDYKKYANESFEGVLFSLDYARSTVMMRDKMIELAESYPNLDPEDSSDDMEGSCDLGGSWVLQGWIDENNNGVVDDDNEAGTYEYVTGSTDYCKLNESMTAILFPVDTQFDSLGASTYGNVWLDGKEGLAIWESFFISQEQDSWHLSSGDNFGFSGVNYYYPDGELEQQAWYQMNLTFTDIADPFNEVSGSWGALYAPAGLADEVLYQVHSLELDADGNNPVFAQENGAFVMKQGVIVSSYYSELPENDGELLFNLRISVDVDPAYLVLELDDNGDGSFDKVDRFLQSELINY